MKKTLFLLLALLIAVSTAACTTGSTSGQPDPDTPTNDWGITLNLENVTCSGATIVCKQSGGVPTGRLQTGSYYVITRLGPDNNWEPLREGETVWTMEAYSVNMGGTTEWKVNWEWLYGQLPDGHYRLGKGFMNFRGPGDYDEMMIYAEFEIK